MLLVNFRGQIFLKCIYCVVLVKYFRVIGQIKLLLVNKLKLEEFEDESIGDIYFSIILGKNIFVVGII